MKKTNELPERREHPEEYLTQCGVEEFVEVLGDALGWYVGETGKFWGFDTNTANLKTLKAVEYYGMVHGMTILAERLGITDCPFSTDADAHLLD